MSNIKKLFKTIFGLINLNLFIKQIKIKTNKVKPKYNSWLKEFFFKCILMYIIYINNNMY